MKVEICVPSDSPSIAAALDSVRDREVEDLVIQLDSEYVEPPEAWPIDLEAGSAGAPASRSLEIIGAPDRQAFLRDAALICNGDGSRVILRSVTVLGSVSLNGAGCRLEDCSVKHGVEVASHGADAVSSCTISARNKGLAVYGPVSIEGNEIVGPATGLCIYGNPTVTITGNTFRSCLASAILLNCCIFAAAGSELEIATQITDSNVIENCAHESEVHVEVEGASSLDFVDEWPLPAGAYSVQRVRGGTVDMEIPDCGAVLRVVGGEDPPPSTRKKRRKAPRSDRFGTLPRGPIGPAWARSLLGLSASGFGERDVRLAYRQKALEVHPDKRRREDVDARKDVDVSHFHEIKEAYEALLESFPKVEEAQRK